MKLGTRVLSVVEISITLLFRLYICLLQRGDFLLRSWLRWQCLTPAFQ